MRKIFDIIKSIQELESKEDNIFKAWESAQLGEIRTHKDGKKYRKVSQTGDRNKDWQLVTQDKGKKSEDQPVSKQGGNEQSKEKQLTPKQLAEHAKNSSENSLQNVIKQSDDPRLRETAHKELDRREKEEKPQEEEKKVDKKEPTKKQESEKEPETKEEVEAEIKRLRDIDTDDIDEITKISDQIQKLLKKRKEVLKQKQSERKVSFEEYRKGFKSFNKDNFKALDDYYLKELENINFTLDEESSVDSYKGENYIYFRHYLTDKKDYIDSYGEDETIQKEIEDISSFILKNKIKESLSLNRRVKSSGTNFFKSLKEGDVYEDKSFSSTSLNEINHFGDFNIEILAKKGSNVANIGNVSEYEYLIDKNSKFRVLKTSKDGIIVELL